MRSTMFITQLMVLALASVAAMNQPRVPLDPAAPAEKAAPKCELLDLQNSPMELQATPTANIWTIKSPNGKHRITLTAENEGASIWISGERETGMIGMLHGYKLPGPVIGIYGPGKGQTTMAAALSAYNPGGGELQLCKLDAPPRFCDAKRLEEIQNVIYPPAKEKAEPAERVPLRE